MIASRMQKKTFNSMKQTTLCYLENDGKYLMLHRTKKQNDINHDKWIGVGGKFEDGETPEQCMLREVFEETGFSVTKWKYRGVVTFYLNESYGETMHLFSCLEWNGKQKVCDEGDLEWIDKQKLAELPMWEGDKIFLDLLEQKVPFFSLKLEYEGDNLKRAKLNNEEISLPYLSSKKY